MPYQIEVFESGPNSLHHLDSLRVAARAWIEGRVKSAADLLDPTLQLLPLKERNKGRFVDLVSL